MRHRGILTIIVIVLGGCRAPIDPQLAEQMRLLTDETRYVLEQETPLSPQYVLSHPAQTIVPDAQPPFRFDPTTAWTMIFGRGGAPIGYNTMRMDAQGTVQLVYYDYVHAPEGGWHLVGKKGLLTLSAEDISAFIEYINASSLLEMPTVYRAAIYDGTRWIFVIEQGEYQKTISCINHFPEEMIEFANTIDRLLIMNGLFEIAWETMPWDEADRYEKTLWK